MPENKTIGDLDAIDTIDRHADLLELEDASPNSGKKTSPQKLMTDVPATATEAGSQSVAHFIRSEQVADFVWNPGATDESGSLYKTWGTLYAAIVVARTAGRPTVNVSVVGDVTMTANAGTISLGGVRFIGLQSSGVASPTITVEDGVSASITGGLGFDGVDVALNEGAATPFLSAIGGSARLRATDCDLIGDQTNTTALFLASGAIVVELFGNVNVDCLASTASTGQVDAYVFGKVGRGANTYIGSSGTVNEFVINPFGLTLGDDPFTNYTGTGNTIQAAPNGLLVGSLGQDLSFGGFAATNRITKQASSSSNFALAAAFTDFWITCDTDTAAGDIEVDLAASAELAGRTFFIRCAGTAGNVVFTLNGVTLIGDADLIEVEDGGVAAVYFETNSTAKLMGELIEATP